MDFFAIPTHSLFWPLMAESLTLSCAAAGALGALWILILRSRQDYGRDYYTFALPYCARWAIAGTLLSLPSAGFAYYQALAVMLPELSHAPSLLLSILACALPVTACVLWGAVICSKTPLRHKPGLCLAALCLAAALTAQVLIFNKVLPSP